MKSIMKYESIINEALRSALNYDTPDEEINEFLRFFGKHIGSDRIYIFEDDFDKHVTNNTYEWCREGVTPQIDYLQDVDMDVIDWWYEAFDKGESVVITDVEQLKGVHQMSYEMLKEQNVHFLVVSPLRYKNQIRGFFGVDNPPDTDAKGLITFLNMVGTLFVSYMKLRDSFKKSELQTKINSYFALGQIYLIVLEFDLLKGTVLPIKAADYIEKEQAKETSIDFSENMKRIMSRLCSKQYIDEMLEFIDFTTLSDRLKKKRSISYEYIGNISGWCRARFIRADYDESADSSDIRRVLFCIENIDDEKRREDRLLYLSQTDLMTGVKNRGYGERLVTEALSSNKKGLLCVLDCDKFKAINDNYGHAVGDKVIIAIANALEAACRDGDVVMRLGGDEFAIFIENMKNEKDAHAFFERIFEGLKKIDIPEMTDDPIFASLGAAFCPEKETVSFDELYRAADTAMYASKQIDGYSYTIHRKTGGYLAI